MSPATAPADQIATLRIELLDTDPLIWRQVDVATSMTLEGLHHVVQAAMGWQDQHLWELRLGKQRYGRPMPGDDWGGPPTVRADNVRLAEILKPRRTVLDYLYDFGDSWEHRLILTGVRDAEPGAAYPRYVAGERPAPPEDCGGIPGFYDALEVLADPEHPDRDEIMDWWEGYDPDVFDEDRVRAAIARLAKPRRAGGRRVAKS